jgi:ABC-type transporter Mla MlaB component
MTLERTADQLSGRDSIDSATVALLASWRRQDATEDPDEIRAAEQELAEFKRAMNEARSLIGESLLYP